MKIKLPFTQSAIEKFREHERKIDAMGDVLIGLQKLVEQVEPEIEAARKASKADPKSVEKAHAWENAKRRLSPNIALSMWEGERNTVQAAQNAERAKPEFVALLAGALRERNGAIQEYHDVKRAALLESLKTSGETNVNVDHMPSLRGLLERRDRNANTIVWMKDHPDNAAPNMHIANALAFLNEPVDYVAPAPPAARPQQGFVAGGGMPVGHGILNPTNEEPDTRIKTVPANTVNIDRIKAEMDQVTTEHERQCRAQAAQIAAANRAKEAQAVGV